MSIRRFFCIPAMVLMPLLAEDEPFATALGAILQRAQMPCADFARHHRALLAPRQDRAHYLEASRCKAELYPQRN